MLKPIRRCAAVHVDPVAGERDLDLLCALQARCGHLSCGAYLTVERADESVLATPS